MEMILENWAELVLALMVVAKVIVNITQTEKDNEIQKITFRHKSLTGDWEFQDMQDFDKIDVTLHYIDENLDTGDILLQKNLSLVDVDNIYNMRYHTTVMATEMVIEILNEFLSKNKKINGKWQPKLGRYFSAMSLEDKYKALDNFLNHKMDIFNE